MGIKPDLLYIYLPFLIVLGIAVAFCLETLVTVLWVLMMVRAYQNHPQALVSNQDLALERLGQMV